MAGALWTVGWRIGLLLLAAVAVSGCASDQGARMAKAPDLGTLDPATSALAGATRNGIDKAAPRETAAARRRITQARAILYGAARAGRVPTDAEQKRVDQLVESAQLDIRAARAHAKMLASHNRLARVKQQQTVRSNNASRQSGAPGDQSSPSALSPTRQGQGQTVSSEPASAPNTPERHAPAMNAGPGAERQSQRPMRSGDRKIGGG